MEYPPENNNSNSLLPPTNDLNNSQSNNNYEQMIPVDNKINQELDAMYNNTTLPSNYMGFFFFSAISWFSLLISACLTFAFPDRELDEISVIWLHLSFHKIDTSAESDQDSIYLTLIKSMMAINIQFYVLNAIIILIYIMILIAFCIVIYSGCFKPNNNFLNELLGVTARFHFLPLMFIIANFILGETYDTDDELENGRFYGSFAATLFALLFLLFISFQTKTQLSSSIDIGIIKATYGCLIAFLTYYLVYLIWFYKFYNDLMDGEFEKDWNKTGAIGGSISIGFINILFSLILKDPIISFINCLICIGKAVYFFDINEDLREEIYSNDASGIIDIGMSILSALMMILLIMNLLSMKNRPQIL